jgi:hypothetical protein
MSLRVQHKFTKIDNNVIHDKRLSGNAVKMYCMMQSFPVGKHASNTYFMKAMSISERTVSRIRLELVSAGYLEVEKISKREYRAFLGSSQVSGLEVKRRFYELHTTKD